MSAGGGGQGRTIYSVKCQRHEHSTVSAPTDCRPSLGEVPPLPRRRTYVLMRRRVAKRNRGAAEIGKVKRNPPPPRWDRGILDVSALSESHGKINEESITWARNEV